MKTARCALLVALSLLGGCGGHYTLLVPDAIAPAGGEAAVVVRLLKNDFFVLDLPVRDAAMRFEFESQADSLRAAYTDKHGYAAAAVPVGQEGGQRQLGVRHLDRQGQEVRACGKVWVMPADAKVLLVRAERALGKEDVADRVRAVGADTTVVYWSDEDLDDLAEIAAKLDKKPLPAGPVLPARSASDAQASVCRALPQAQIDQP